MGDGGCGGDFAFLTNAPGAILLSLQRELWVSGLWKSSLAQPVPFYLAAQASIPFSSEYERLFALQFYPSVGTPPGNSPVPALADASSPFQRHQRQQNKDILGLFFPFFRDILPLNTKNSEDTLLQFRKNNFATVLPSSLPKKCAERREVTHTFELFGRKKIKKHTGSLKI